MDCQHSEAVAALQRLRNCVEHGDWQTAETIARGVDRPSLPADVTAVSEYLILLKETLIAAKAARSNVLAALSRANAAARFHATAPPRSLNGHYSVTSAIF